MIFNAHYNLTGKHAFLGASDYHWLNYTPEKLETVFYNLKAKERGTELHAFAAQCIKLHQKLSNSKDSLHQYVNDAIGFGMSPEVVLFYSDNCFGTADAICFRDGMLRIHDYKSGIVAASLKQLEIYAALFCLEYDVNPFDIQMELRLYQNSQIVPENPDPNDILEIMNTIKDFDRQIESFKKKEYGNE